MTDWKTDAEAGTQGEWVCAIDGDYMQIVTRDCDAVCMLGSYQGPHMKADASRIARVPAYEEALRAAEAMDAAIAAYDEAPVGEAFKAALAIEDARAAFREAMKKL